MQFSFFKMADMSNVNTNTALGNVGRQMESILNNLGLGVLFKMADMSNVNTNTALGNVGRQMESILNNLGLGVLSERFARERMEPKTVLSASDADLERLGVDTIGQRIRITVFESCARKKWNNNSRVLLLP